MENKEAKNITELTINIPELGNYDILDIAAGDDFSLILIRTRDNQTKIIKFGTEIIFKYVSVPNVQSQNLEKIPNSVTGNINKIIHHIMKDIGKTIYKKGRGKKNGLMVLHLKDNIKAEKDVGLELLSGLMVLFTKEILMTINLME